MTNTIKDKEPDPVDLHVGSRVRLRRKFLGKTQEELALALDLTFQQIQKYERGSNRISASKLYQIAKYLKCPIQYFFDGVDDGGGDGEIEAGLTAERAAGNFLMTAEGIDLAASFPKIKRQKLRRSVLQLVAALTDEEPTENAA